MFSLVGPFLNVFGCLVKESFPATGMSLHLSMRIGRGQRGQGREIFLRALQAGIQWACNARPKAPSTNIQAPEKHQEPSSKTCALRVWSLKFDASLVFGARMLVLLAPPYSRLSSRNRKLVF